MYFVELQISAQVLLPAVQTGMGIQAAPQVGSVFTSGGTDYVVKNASVVNDTALHTDVQEFKTIFFQTILTNSDGSQITSDTIQGPRVQISQGLQYDLLRKVKDQNGMTVNLVDAGSFDVEVILGFTVSTSSTSPPILVLGVDDVSGPAGADPGVTTALAGMAAAAAPAIAAAIPVLLPGAVVYNAGISLDVGRSLIAIRTEYGVPAAVDGLSDQEIVGAWQQFFNGVFANHLSVAGQTGGLSMFMVAEMVKNQVKQAIWAGLDQHQDTFTLQGGVTPAWAPTPSGGPHVDASFTGDAILPDGLPNISADVSVGVGIAVAATPPNTLITNSHVDYHVSAVDQLLLDAAAAIIGAVTGGVAGAELAGPGGAGLGALGGFVTGVIGMTVFFNQYVPQMAAPYCTQSGADVTCTTTIPGPTDPTTKQPIVRMVSAVGAPDGMVIFCSAAFGGLRLQSAKLQITAVREFRWQPLPIACSQVTPGLLGKIKADASAYTQAIATVVLNNAGQAPLVVTSVERITPDPAGVFPASRINLFQLGAAWQVEVDAITNPAYIASGGYGCGLMIVSNGGIEIVTLGPIPAFDDAAGNAVIAEAEQAISSCLVALDPWWQDAGPLSLNWLIDPPPDGSEDVWHYTEVEVAGLAPGEAISLASSRDGAPAVTATGMTDGVARISALDTAAVGVVFLSKQESLTAELETGTRQAAAAAAAARSERHITVRQVELVECSRQVLPAPCGYLELTTINGAPATIWLAGGTVGLLSLATPARPRLMAATAVDGAAGVLHVRDELIVWGSSGLTRLSLSGKRSQRVDDEPLAAAVSLGTLVMVARRDGRLEVLRAPDLHKVGEAREHTGVLLAATSRLIVSAANEGLCAWSLAGDGRPMLAGTLPLPKVSVLACPLQLVPRTAVYAEADGGNRLAIDFANPDEPRLLARYQLPPWPLRTTMHGSLVLLANPDQAELSIATSERELILADLTPAS